jgi:acyl carrier protein
MTMFHAASPRGIAASRVTLPVASDLGVPGTYPGHLSISWHPGLTAGSGHAGILPAEFCLSRKALPVIDSIRQFILSSLVAMNYDVDGVGDDTYLGPRGADLESLTLAELAVRVEDEFGVKFSDEEAEELAGKTVGEFCAIVAGRLPAPQAEVR